MFFQSIYCETAHAASFPFELLNSYSSLPTVVFGAVAFVYLIRHHSHRRTLYTLALLLTLTGLGSFLWHSTRSEWGLILDVAPAIAFFSLFVFSWFRFLFGVSWAAILAVIATFTTASLVEFGPGLNTLDLATLSAVAAVMAVGGILAFITHMTHGRVGWLSVAAIALAISGIIFCSLDLVLCPYISVGTHFIWHVTLGLAGLVGIVFLLRLDEVRVEREAQKAI